MMKFFYVFFHFEDSKDGPLSSLREAAFSKMYDDNDVPKTPRETSKFDLGCTWMQMS